MLVAGQSASPKRAGMMPAPDTKIARPAGRHRIIAIITERNTEHSVRGGTVY